MTIKQLCIHKQHMIGIDDVFYNALTKMQDHDVFFNRLLARVSPLSISQERKANIMVAVMCLKYAIDLQKLLSHISPDQLNLLILQADLLSAHYYHLLIEEEMMELIHLLQPNVEQLYCQLANAYIHHDRINVNSFQLLDAIDTYFNS